MKFQTLAEKDGFGRVGTCGSCAGVHVSFKDLTVNLTRTEFEDLASMLQRAVSTPRLAMQRSHADGDFTRLFSRA